MGLLIWYFFNVDWVFSDKCLQTDLVVLDAVLLPFVYSCGVRMPRCNSMIQF